MEDYIIHISYIKASVNLTKYTTNRYFSSDLCIYRFGAKNLSTLTLSSCKSDENPSSLRLSGPLKRRR